MNYDDIVVGICWYDDPSIFRLLDSLPQQVRKIVVDGKFLFYDSNRPLSPDHMRQRVRSYGNVTIIDAPNLKEHEKRNVYLEAMAGYRYGLMLDSDEWVTGDWDEFLGNCQGLDGIRQVRFNIGGDTFGCFPRLWVNPSDWEYHTCHNIFKNEKMKTIIRSTSVGNIVSGITCHMDDSLRSQEYIDAVYQYQIKLIEDEVPRRNQFKRNGTIRI